MKNQYIKKFCKLIFMILLHMEIGKKICSLHFLSFLNQIILEFMITFLVRTAVQIYMVLTYLLTRQSIALVLSE